MTQITTSTGDSLIVAPTTKGAIELGIENPIRSLLNNPNFYKGISEIIETIWTHYCGANPDYLSEEFEKEAIELITKKFSMLGTNEIKEAFRLASVNIINADLRAFGGRINTQVIGNVLSAYIAYRNPIHKKIIDQKELEKRNQEQLDNIEAKKKYREEVINWFKSKPKVDSYKEVRFYQYEILEQEGLVNNTIDEIQEFVNQAKQIIELEKSQLKHKSSNIMELRNLVSTFNSNKNARVKNLAKELALFDAIKKNY